MTYDEYLTEAKRRNCVAMSRASFEAWMAVTPDPFAQEYERVLDSFGVAGYLPVGTWRDREPMI